MGPPEPETPIPPWASEPRRRRRETPLSPSFSRCPVPETSVLASASAAADADNGGAVSEHPCVPLHEWWLATVEGDDQKIAVAGLYTSNKADLELAPAPIAKRHRANTVETEDGVILLISGFLNLSRMRDNGYSSTVCEEFMLGFPHWWESCNQLYPKETNSHTGCPPSSSCTVNTEKDSKLFYLEQYQLGERFRLHAATLMSKFPKNVKRTTPGRDYAFKKSSHFSNGASRFEEHAFGGDIGTGEKAAYSNDDGERDEAVCNEVNNVQIDLTAGRALRDDGDIETNASLELTVERANDAGNEKADNAPPTSVQGTPVVSLNTQGCQAKSQQIALSEKAAVDEEMPTSVCTDVQNSSHLSNDIPRYEENTCLDDIPTNEESAALNDKSETVCIDVQNSSYLSNDIRRFEENTFHDDIPTNEDAAALNDNIESTAVAEEVASLEIGLNVGSAIRERGHDDITTNVYLDPTVECANKIVNEGVESTSLLGCKETPVASLKSQGCQDKHLLPSHVPKKQSSESKRLQGPPRPPLTSPVLFAHESMSTPEALKLRKTKSGRVIVPTLDAGCQRIVYDTDGTIAGVVGLDSPSPKGSKLRSSSRKKRRAEPAAASKLKTYARKKRRAEPAAASKLKTYARKRRRAEPAAASKLKTYARKRRRAESPKRRAESPLI